MEAFEKIRAFLRRLNEEYGEILNHFELFSDGSCGICDWKGNSYLGGESVKDLIDKIDNYQWDTNTAPAKQ